MQLHLGISIGPFQLTGGQGLVGSNVNDTCAGVGHLDDLAAPIRIYSQILIQVESTRSCQHNGSHGLACSIGAVNVGILACAGIDVVLRAFSSLHCDHAVGIAYTGG